MAEFDLLHPFSIYSRTTFCTVRWGLLTELVAFFIGPAGPRNGGLCSHPDSSSPTHDRIVWAASAFNDSSPTAGPVDHTLISPRVKRPKAWRVFSLPFS